MSPPNGFANCFGLVIVLLLLTSLAVASTAWRLARIANYFLTPVVVALREQWTLGPITGHLRVRLPGFIAPLHHDPFQVGFPITLRVCLFHLDVLRQEGALRIANACQLRFELHGGADCHAALMLGECDNNYGQPTANDDSCSTNHHCQPRQLMSSKRSGPPNLNPAPTIALPTSNPKSTRTTTERARTQMLTILAVQHFKCTISTHQ